MSQAVDDAVSQLNFSPLQYQTVYLDVQNITNNPDKNYIIGSLRQQILASGCLLKDDRNQADFVVEARTGAVGTDRHDLLFGIPQIQAPPIPVAGLVAMPSIPEIPIAKRTEQKGVAKLAVFAYNQKTGRAVWQSGTIQSDSTSKDVWVMGAGPFRHGSIRKNTEFASSALLIPFFESDEDPNAFAPAIPVTQPVIWEDRGTIPEAVRIIGSPKSEKKSTPEKK